MEIFYSVFRSLPFIVALLIVLILVCLRKEESSGSSYSAILATSPSHTLFRGQYSWEDFYCIREGEVLRLFGRNRVERISGDRYNSMRLYVERQNKEEDMEEYLHSWNYKYKGSQEPSWTRSSRISSWDWTREHRSCLPWYQPYLLLMTLKWETSCKNSQRRQSCLWSDVPPLGRSLRGNLGRIVLQTMGEMISICHDVFPAKFYPSQCKE